MAIGAALIAYAWLAIPRMQRWILRRSPRWRHERDEASNQYWGRFTVPRIGFLSFGIVLMLLGGVRLVVDLVRDTS